MSYQVLARKYRPQTFDEVVGQEHVTATLKNAILKNRLHHAYLFTGVRGTGKTSLARIFAKSLDCEKGPTDRPCGQCSHCLAIARGNFLDVIEIDGASNTSVESIRELREQVKYLPAAARYKIYLIDEVHMLSTSAFNALLKTLEEPPSHVLFLFATTEVHKIPVTILSRCQRFDLRRLSQALLKERLAHICREEGVQTDAESLEILARAAEGSMRDAQSLLDMAIGLCGAQLEKTKLLEMLGLAEGVVIQDLTQDCLQGRLPEALAKVSELYQRGFDLRQVALQWVEYFHDLALLKAAGPASLGEGVSADQREEMEKTVEAVDLVSLQIAFQTLYRAAEEIHRSESPKILLDLALVKLVHGTPFQPLSELLTGKAPVGSAPRVSVSTAPRPEIPRTEAPRSAAPPPIPPRISEPEPARASSAGSEELLERALKKRPQLRAILENALSHYWEGDHFFVVFEKKSIWPEMFEEKRSVLAEALAQDLGRPVKVSVREEVPQKTASAIGGAPEPSYDPVVQEAIEVLNARVQEVKRLNE